MAYASIIANQDDKNQKSAYQQNVSQPIQPVQPVQSARQETLGKIYKVAETDPERARQLYGLYEQSARTPGTPVYNQYSQPTNQAVGELAKYGINANGMTTDWFKNNTSWQQYLQYNGTTNTPSKPGKRASANEWKAYWTYQIYKSAEDTDNAEREWSALKQELSYKAKNPNRNDSDDEILNGIDWSKYSTLRKMMDTEGINPVELNRGIGFSKDDMLGVLWAARNGYEGDNSDYAIAMGALGQGNVWQENAALRAKLNWNNSDTYSPYSAGMTLDQEVGMYFDMTSFDQNDIERLRQTIDPNDATAVKMFQQVQSAWDNTKKAEDELAALEKKIDTWVKQDKDRDTILKLVEKQLDKNCPTLKAMDESIETGGSLVETTKAINYKKQDFLNDVGKYCDANRTKSSGDDFSAEVEQEAAPITAEPVDAITSAAPVKTVPQMTDQEKAIVAEQNKALSDAGTIVEEVGTPAERTASTFSWSAAFDRTKTAIKTIRDAYSGQMNQLVQNSIKDSIGATSNAILTGTDVIAGYERNAAKLEEVNNRVQELESTLGDLIYSGMDVNGFNKTSIHIMSGDVPMKVDIEFNNRTGEYEITRIGRVDGQHVPTSDATINAVMEEAKKRIPGIMDTRNRVASVSGVALSEEEKAMLDEYNALVGQRDSLVKYARENDAAYNEAKDNQTKAEAKRTAVINMLQKAGVPAEELKVFEETGAVIDVLKGFSQYDPTVWEAFNAYDLYAQDIAFYGADNYGKVFADAEEGDAQNRQELETALWVLDYSERMGIDIPDNIKNNINRYIAKLERDHKDFEYFSVLGNDDFDEMVQRGRSQVASAEWDWGSYDGTLQSQPAWDMLSDEQKDQLISMMDVYDINDVAMTFENMVSNAAGDPVEDRLFGMFYAGNLMSDYEIDTYYYLLAKEGQEAADAYYNHLTDSSYGALSVRSREALEEGAKDMADQGFLGRRAADVTSIILAPAAAFGSAAYGAEYMLKKLTGQEVEYNPNNPWLSFNQFRASARSEIQEEIKRTYGEGSVAQKIFSSMQEIISNRGDSMMNMMAFGWLTNGMTSEMAQEFIGALPMAAGAAADVMAQAKEKGASDTQAWLVGSVALLCEAGTEAISISNIKDAFKAGQDVTADTVRSFLENWVKEAGWSEALGESLNDLFENAADEAFMGPLSDHARRVAELKEADPSMSDDEAEAQARREEFSSILHTAIISFLSPGMDVIPLAAGRVNYYRAKTKFAQQNGANVNIFDVMRSDKAIRERVDADAAAMTEAAETTSETTEQAEQTAQAEETAVEAPQEEASEEEAGTAVSEEEWKQTQEQQIASDYTLLDKAKGADVKSQTATLAAVLDIEGTDVSNDIAKAVATKLNDFLQDTFGGKAQNAVEWVQDLLLGASEGNVDVSALKQAITNMVLGGMDSAAYQELYNDKVGGLTEEFSTAELDHQAQRLAATVEQDAANTDLQETIGKNVRESRVAEAEGKLIADGGTTLVGSDQVKMRLKEAQTAQVTADRSSKALDNAKKTLEARQRAMEASGEAVQKAAADLRADPSDQNKKAMIAALNKHESNATVYEQSVMEVKNTEEANRAAQEANRAAQDEVMGTLRRTAENLVAQEDQRRSVIEEKEGFHQELIDNGIIMPESDEFGFASDEEMEARKNAHFIDAGNVIQYFGELTPDMVKRLESAGFRAETSFDGDTGEEVTAYVIDSENTNVETLKALNDEANSQRQAAQESSENALNADVDTLIEQDFPNATEEQKEHIREMAKQAYNSMQQESAAEGVVTVDELMNRRKVLNRLGKRYGFNVDIRDTTEGGKTFFSDGYFDRETNTLVLDRSTTLRQAMYKILGHELTHIAEQSETYGELANALLRNAYGEGVAYNGILQQMENGDISSQLAQDILFKKMTYDEVLGKEHSYKYMLEEVIADKMGDILNGDQELINRLAREEPGVIRRIIDAIKNFINGNKNVKGEWQTESQRIVDMLETALSDAQKNNENEGKRYDLTALATDDQGDVLATELPGGTVALDTDLRYSLNSFNPEEQERVRQALYDAKDENGNNRFTKDDVDQYLKDALGIASMIANDRGRLDYLANPAQKYLKPNNDYFFTLDASTLCAKRLLYQGTFDYVQHALPDEVFTPEDLIDLVNIMSEMGYETPCGICYVESRRRWLDTYAQEFLDKTPKDVDTFVEKRFKKASAEEKAALRERLSGEMPSIEDLTTSDGLENLRVNDPLMHKAFVAAMNAKGTANPKVVQLRTEYRGDIRDLTEKDIQKVKDIGGLRIQSFSDFETPHLLDMIQAVYDMASVGLTSQAYTKVPNFAWVFGDTGIKINLSLIGKGSGLDEKGNLVFDNVEGMNFDEAMRLRDRYSKNVGTIIVGINDDHIIAAMADPRIDFIIPFHKSGWSDNELKGIPSLHYYKDYTDTQNEKKLFGKDENGEWIRNSDGSYKTIPGKESKLKNFEPVGAHKYWEFDKDGEWNSRKYLQMCAKDGRIPKFSQFLVDKGDGTFSLPEGDDPRSTAIRTGYWKTLIDFKMYDNNGNGAEQMAVTPDINMVQAQRVLDEHKLGRQMPDRPDGTKGEFIPTESNNDVPVAVPPAEEYIRRIKEKRRGNKPIRPLDSLEATPVLEVSKLGKSYFHQADDETQGMTNASTAAMASGAETELGNTASNQEEYAANNRNAMAIDAETGETVDTRRHSLPSQRIDNLSDPDWFDRYLETLSAEEMDDLAQEMFGISLSSEPKNEAKPDLNVTAKEKELPVAQLRNLYKDAMENGDRGKARNLIDRIAKKAGYTIKGTHRTNAEFTVFDRSKQTGKNGKSLGDGFYVASGEGTEYDTDNYGKNRMLVYVRPGKVFNIQEKGLTKKQAKEVYDKYFAPAHPTLSGYGNPYTSHVIGQLQKSSKVMDYIKEAAENGNVTTDVIFKELGYDSIKDGPQYVVFDPEQIKSADLTTYGDDGEQVEIGERFNRKNPDIRYSLPSDAPYMAAVERGEMDEAQRMVDEKAKESGYNVEYAVWRGDSEPYNVLKPGFNGGNLGTGLYFTPNRTYAERFATRNSPVRKFYLKPGETFSYDDFTQTFNDYAMAWVEENDGIYANSISQIDEYTWSMIWDDFISENDYDSVKATGVGGMSYGASEISVQNSWQAKLADPVTYDDAGDVIPLSERFNDQTDDIRYDLPSDKYLQQKIQRYLKSGGSISAPLEGQNPTMTTGLGPKERAFGSADGMLMRSDEAGRFAKAVTAAQNTYFPDTNDAQIKRAIKWIGSLKQTPNSDGYAEALQAVTADDFDYRSADGQARMVVVMAMANAKNDLLAQTALDDAFDRQGTDIGRMMQVRKLFLMMTPEGRQQAFRNMLRRQKMELGRRGKNIDLTFSNWIYQMAAAAQNENDLEKVREAAYNELADQIPANWRDRIRSLRMLSMLANPRTHIRNVIGNMLFIPAVSIKNKLGAVAEITTRRKERTKTLSLVTSKENRDFARQDAENIKSLLTGEAKYNEATRIRKAQSMLGKALDWLSEKNSNALEREDWIFLKGHYRRALGGWMQANGYTPAQLRSDNALLEKGRQYAISEAQKATYRDFNKTAAWLNQASRSGGVKGFVVDAVLPFRKTPANILKRGLEYSPAGLAKSLTVDMYHMKQYLDYQKGKLNVLPEKALSPTQVIDHICAGLSGTAITTLGFLLAGTGAVSCGLDDDEDKLEKAKGGQEYAVNIGKAGNAILGAFGVPKLFGEDVTFTLDWAAPMSMPFFVGAAIRDELENGGKFDIDNVVNAFGNITEPVTNLSMLDGVNTLFKTSQYEDTDTLTQIGAKVLTNYATSYVPSVLGAVSRTFFDDKQRKAFVKQGEGTGITGTIRYAIEQAENKIPGVAQTNIASRNIWGEEKTTGFLERLFENFILPGYISKVEDDPILNEMGRLYEVTGDAGMIPKEDPGKSITVNKEKRVLAAEQWDQYKASRNQTAHKELTDLLDNPDYQNAADSVKAQMIKDVWSHADQVGKHAVFPDYELKQQNVGQIAKDGKVDGLKNELVKALEAEDYDAYETMVEAIRAEFDDEKDANAAIKKKIGDTYRDKWKAAYLDGDEPTMTEIEEVLGNTGFDFNIYDGDVKGSKSWQEQVDEKYDVSTPKQTTQQANEDYMSDPNTWTVPGLVERGNIDLDHRKVKQNSDGSISTEKSFSTEIDGVEVLLPTIIDGREVSEDEAIQHYLETGEHLGKFSRWQDAEAYAEKLHNRQDWFYHQ